MKTITITIAFLHFLATSGHTAAAAPAPSAPGATVAQLDTAPCQKEVRDYVNVLRFVKQTSGDGIGGRVEQAYVKEADLAVIVQKIGPCGAAMMLRQRGVAR